MNNVLRLALLAFAVGFAVAPSIASAQAIPYECGAEPTDPDGDLPPDESQCPGQGGGNPPPPPPSDPLCGAMPWFCHEN